MTPNFANRVAALRRGLAVAGLALVASAALAGGAAPAQAQHHDNDRWHHDNDRWHHSWGRGYYRPPPVVYGSPYRQRYYVAPRYAPRYYQPPPLVYGPGVSLNFRFR